MQTPQELEAALGRRLRELRIQKNITQADLAASAGIGRRSLVNLEAGRGSTVQTLLSTLKALRLPDPLAAIAARPQVQPLAILRASAPPQRASRKRKPQ
jgi:transcriptional regulator with XRE-family HTH domain